jgi:DNA-binding GntR family transcriptional regulator
MKATDRIYAAIDEEIRLGTLLPGDLIDEADYLNRFQVSRTPLREALLQLEAQGMLASLPRGGMVVAKMTIQQLLSMWELLALLEGNCASLACERMSTEERMKLARVHRDALDAVERNDIKQWHQINHEFHEILYKGSHNPYLHQEIVRMRSRTGAYRRHAFEAFGKLKVSYEQHEEIVEAILARDAYKASTLMTQHLQPAQGTNSLTDFITTLPHELLS